MARIFVLGDVAARAGLRQWLGREATGTAQQPCPSAYIVLTGCHTTDAAEDGVPILTMADAAMSMHEQDIVIVAGPDFDAAVGEFLHRGVRNLFDGNAILRTLEPDHRFLSAASRFYIGPTEALGSGLPVNEAARFDIQPLKAGSVPAHKLFIVNSMPKSGTLWMAGMLGALLGVRAREQITLSHAGDLELDWNKANNHAAVTLVRDLRAVVVSWFHHACRNDRDLGFRSPRYPTIESFYWQHFLGTIRTTRRFYHGDLERWLDLAGANYVPIVRFEDLLADTPTVLRRVADAWRIDVEDAILGRVGQDFAFKNLPTSVGQGDGYLSDMVSRGHLRRGQAKAWKDELPLEIANDVQRRFQGYQARLGYGDHE